MATALPIPLTPFPWGDIAIILALIALNGVLAMSELAIVSARRARLESITKKSQLRGAKTALQLAANPGRFLSTVQIGITLIGIIAGAVKALNEEKGNMVSRFGLKRVYGSTLVSLLSAVIAGVMI